MSIHPQPHAMPDGKGAPLKPDFSLPADGALACRSAVSMYEREVEKQKATEAELRQSAARETAPLRQQDDLIRRQDIFSKESEHRLLNGLQLVTSLLTMQGRAAESAEAAALLTAAANRVAAIGRVHRHLHALDHVESVAFKQYLEDLCRDLIDMASSENAANILVVEGIELQIPAAKGLPLGLIANELITNAIKHAKGRITVGLQTSANGHALSVNDDGIGLPDGFDPAAHHGLGMKLISALVRQIGGQLQIAPGNHGKGTRVTVLFS